MDWNDEETASADDAATTQVVVRHKARLSFLNALVAMALLLAIGGFGFFLGHDVVKPTAPSATSRSNLPTFPSGGSGDGFGDGNFSPSTVTPPRSASTSSGGAAAAKIAASVDAGIVDINTNLTYQGGSAAGTGMILKSDGLVLTNNHVIDGATSITARDVATGKVYKAKVVGYDVTSDVAVLKLKDASGLSTVTLGSSKDLAKADKVVGIGNAGGVGGTPSYAAGKVVALNQTITASDQGSSSGAEQLSGMIETDANVLPGDSGGPLVNAKGKVVGMDTAGSSSNGGFGFEQTSLPSATQAYAIPIDSALAVVKSIVKGHASTTVHLGGTAFLGVEVLSANAGASTSSVQGATVEQVIAGAPAASTALSAGDVITSLDGQSVTSPTSLAQILQSLRPKQTVQLSYVDQSGTHATLSVTLASGPPQ